MNWIGYTALSLAARRFALLFCALFLAAGIAMAEPEEGGEEEQSEENIEEIADIPIENKKKEQVGIIDDKNVLIIGIMDEDDTWQNAKYVFKTEDMAREGEEILLTAIKIEEKGVLVVKPGTDLELERPAVGLPSITIQEGGTLKLFTSASTKIHSIVAQEESSGEEENSEATEESELEEDEEEEPLGGVWIQLNGGTLEIRYGDACALTGTNLHLSLGSGGGTVDVGNNLTFTSGTISGGNQSGDLLKMGEGTWEIDGTTNVPGTFNVREGNVTFLEKVLLIGKLNLEHTNSEGVIIFNKEVTKIGELNVGIKLPPDTEEEEESGGEESEEEENETESEVTPFKGTVIFQENAAVDTLRLYAGTVEAHGKLTVKGGGIEGTLMAGHLEVQAGILNFAAGEDHAVGKITIAQGAMMDMHAGTKMTLGWTAPGNEGAEEGAEESEGEGEGEGEGGGTESDNTAEPVDILVQGTLKIEQTATFSKGGEGEEAIRIRLAGSGSSGGVIHIYKKKNEEGEGEGEGEVEEEGEEEELVFGSKLYVIEVLGYGTIQVDEGLTFITGNVTMPEDNSTEAPSGANLTVMGGGIYQADEVNLGEGYLWLGDNTTMITSGETAAGELRIGEGSRFHAGEKAQFGSVQIGGIYDGKIDEESKAADLTITVGGWMLGGGQIINVGTLTLGNSTSGGTLYLEGTQIKHGDNIIDVQSLDAGDSMIKMIRGKTGTYEGIIKMGEWGSDTLGLDDWIAELNKSSTALYNPVWSQQDLGEEEGISLNLNLKIYGVEEYIGDPSKWNQRSRNALNAGKLLDKLCQLYPDEEYNLQLRYRLELMSDAQLRGTIQHLMAGELIGNAMRIAMHQPANNVFRHLDNVAPLRSPFVGGGEVRGQVREGFNVWFTSYGQAEHARGDGSTFDGYNAARYGFYVGGDIELYNRAVAGVMFGYAAPSMKNALGKVTANDYTGGVYFRMPTVWDVSLNVMAGFGSQDYQFRNSLGTTPFKGSSLFASVELSRPFSFGGHSSVADGWRTARLTPLIALDFQTASMDGILLADPFFAPYGGLRVEPESLDSTSLRLGLLGEVGRFRTRLQYTRQIAGKDFVTSSTSFAWDGSATSVPIQSVHWGKDWLNAGIGYEFLSTRHWRIFTDYDFGAGKRSTSHLGALNVILKW